MRDGFTIVLASTNQGKLAELRELLADLPVRIVSVKEALGYALEVSEDGDTFEENAILKARAVSLATDLTALADDSGLEVPALGGRPGVRSARFAHEQATDTENNAALLRELEACEVSERSARFRCVLALVTPGNDPAQTVAGTCDGEILRAPRGSGGFGYDPLFAVAGQGGRTMAELSDEEKNRISHRGLAVRALRPKLLAWLNERLDPAKRVFK